MPTGYTAKLMESGQTFPEFALRCARAFGALIEMREAPLDAEIPERFTPSDYYLNKVQTDRANLKNLLAMSKEERLAFGEKDKLERLSLLRDALEKDQLENSRLLEMRDHVTAWHPPSPEHEGLKNFMLDQIKISLNQIDYLQDNLHDIEAKPAIEFHTQAVEILERSIVAGSTHYRDEVDSTERRNEWLRQLRESLFQKENTIQ